VLNYHGALEACAGARNGYIACLNPGRQKQQAPRLARPQTEAGRTGIETFEGRSKVT
jgi:hypothetical protein